MVEGGQSIHTQFLAAGRAHELQLVIAPFFVGDPELLDLSAPQPSPGSRATG